MQSVASRVADRLFAAVLSNKVAAALCLQVSAGRNGRGRVQVLECVLQPGTAA